MRRTPPLSTRPQEDVPLTDSFLEVAREAAREAARLHRDAAGTLTPDHWSEKSTSDFVTDVDREAERLIVERLTRAFPDHAFLAEEGTGASELGHACAVWVIDPLDGTTNWLHGYPEYAVSIAAVDRDGLRAAVVINSSTEEEFEAERGRGARRNGEPIRVSRLERLELALVGTGFPFKHPPLVPTYLDQLGRVLTRTSGVRRGGSAALDLCDVACGRLDAFWELWLMPWDVAAGALIVKEAGGVFQPLQAHESLDVLDDAAVGARSFVDWYAGLAPVPDAVNGAYLCGNPVLAEKLRSVVANR